MVATPQMSDSQVAIVKASWEKVKGQGVDVLYYFLSKFPENQAVFKSFVGKDLTTLKSLYEYCFERN